MPLNDLTVPKPGRVPDHERVSLKALLNGNGFTDVECLKAVSANADALDLNTRFARVEAVEDKFDKGNITPQKRRKLRTELETEYDLLLDAAQRYVDDATAAYQDAVEAQVDVLRAEYPGKDEMFMNIWKDRSQRIAPDARLAKWVGADQFRTDIRNRYKAKYKLKAAKVSPLNPLEQQALQAEQHNITVQLNAWDGKRDDAPGCNDIGTWGTSAGGAGGGFAVSAVSRNVWNELVVWWRNKQNTYITPSDTSSRSLKKTRVVDDGRSPTINYHINIV
ncbi:hypothetical protein B0I31_11641 [Saccharothrix carnea]|uniref:Uncharacterized protein n=1 Tax=Saccharothrix carnea TaxID=1280637 RepID=A0A2P8I0I2_SACCR|nr:hypothetical protein [Saccharothrix carnea]PSL51965.1 hypothetical protein B0I31_11641 [Saccharothrix carnea]